MAPVELLSGPLAQRWALALVHFVWQGILVAALLVVLLKLKRVRRAQVRYLVCLVAMAVAAACPVVTFALIDAGPESEKSAIAFPTYVPILSGAQDGQPGELIASGHAAALAPPMPTPHRAPADREEPASLTAAWLAYAKRAQPWVLLLWVTGVLVLSGRLLLGTAGVKRLKRHLHPVSAELAHCARRLGHRLGMKRLPAVCASAKVLEATALGFFRPMVLIPAAWLTGLSPALLEAVLAHELAHIRRWDLWVNLFQRVIETLLFYHPAVWWLSRRLRNERELCCDELAVAATGDRLSYVTALEQVARRRRAARQLVLGAAIGGTNMPLLDRVRNVLGVVPSTPSLSRWPAGILAATVPLGIWLCAAMSSLSLQAQQPALGQRSLAASADAPDDALRASAPVEPNPVPSASAGLTNLAAAQGRRATAIQVLQHDDKVTSVAWSPKGDTLAASAGRGDADVYIWTRQGWGLSQRIQSKQMLKSLAFAPDGKTLAAAGARGEADDEGFAAFHGQAKIFDRTGATVMTLDANTNYLVDAIAFSPNGRILAGGSAMQRREKEDNVIKVYVTGGRLLLWDTLTSGLVEFSDDSTAGWIYAVAFSPDGKLLATGNQGVSLWDTQTNQVLRKIKARPNALAFSPQGDVLATGGYELVQLWNVESGKLLRQLKHTSFVRTVAFSPDGNLLSAGGALIQKGVAESVGGELVLWDAKTGELLQNLDDHALSVNCVVFSPDGKLLASASDDKTVRVWDLGGVVE